MSSEEENLPVNSQEKDQSVLDREQFRDEESNGKADDLSTLTKVNSEINENESEESQPRQSSHEYSGKIEVEELPHPGNTLDFKSKLESAPTEEDRAELSRERSKRRKLTEEVDGPAMTSSRSTMTKFKKGETDDVYFHKSEVTKDSMAPSGTDQNDGCFPPFRSKRYRDGVDEQDIYPMRRNPRGLAFIINNKDFKPASGMEKYPRNGTDVDAEALEKLFKDLKFVTTVYRNKGTQDIFDIVDQYATADYSRYDCFMCAILTHGGEGLIYSTDGQIQIKDLISKFRAGNLTGKPKIFFFQDCQGYEYMEGVDQHDAVIGLDFDEVDPGSNRITIPTEADFLFAYSTVPGYYSWRNSGRGSWFVQAIVSVFHQHALTMDLLRMLTRVNSEVAKWKSNTESEVSRNKKQIPCLISQLRKELYFFPEKVVDPE